MSSASKRERYYQRKLEGRCVDCNAGLGDDDGLTCVECTARRAASAVRYRSTDQGRAKSQEQARRYAASERGREVKRAYRMTDEFRAVARAKVAADRADRKARGQCLTCSLPAVEGRTLCARHAEMHLRAVQRSRAREEGAR